MTQTSTTIHEGLWNQVCQVYRQKDCFRESAVMVPERDKDEVLVRVLEDFSIAERHLIWNTSSRIAIREAINVSGLVYLRFYREYIESYKVYRLLVD